MKRTAALTILCSLFFGAWALTATAQSGGGHSLYGDLKVDDSAITGVKPQTYQVVLLNVGSGLSFARQTVPNNARYRFFNVPNGEYDLIVESGGNEAGRVRLLIQERFKTDIRKDLELSWSSDRTGSGVKAAGTVSAAERYQRPEEYKGLFDKAQKSMAGNQYADAVGPLSQIVASDPKDFEAWTELGTAWFQQKKYKEAEEAYGKSLEAKPGFALAQLNLGRLQMARGNFDAAVQVLEKTVADHPDSAEANYLLGESYLQIKKGSKAVGYLNQALKLDPVGKAEAHLRLAALYNGAKMFDRAVSEYEQFLAKVPDTKDRKKLEQYIRDHKK